MLTPGTGYSITNEVVSLISALESHGRESQRPSKGAEEEET